MRPSERLYSLEEHTQKYYLRIDGEVSTISLNHYSPNNNQACDIGTLYLVKQQFTLLTDELITVCGFDLKTIPKSSN